MTPAPFTRIHARRMSALALGAPAPRALLLALAGVLTAALILAAPASAAEAPVPFWHAFQEVTPTNLAPEGAGVIVVQLGDLGDAPVSASGGHPVDFEDMLPASLTATSISGAVRRGTINCTLGTPLRCESTEVVLYPYEQITVKIHVTVNEPAGTVTELPNVASIEGGGALRADTSTQNVQISGAPTPFGIQENFEMVPYEADGEPATIAGSHPFSLTSTVVMNQIAAAKGPEPVALPRNFTFKLPLGLVGDPQATEQCPSALFLAHEPDSEVDECPPGSAVGVAAVTVTEPETVSGTYTVPLFNLVPSKGEPARFGFDVLGKEPVIIGTAVDPGDDYDVIARVENATQLAWLLSSQVTFWGVPGDPRHNESRGWECINDGRHYEAGEVSRPCPATTSLPQTPLLTLPSSCASNPSSEPLKISMQAESWPKETPPVEPGLLAQSEYTFTGPLGEPLGFTGCEGLSFEPALRVAPEEAQGGAVHSGSAPTGLSVSVELPQGPAVEAGPEGRGESDLRASTVTLPAGVQLNPSAANGLQACPERAREGSPYEGIGFEGFRKFLGPEREPSPEAAVFSSTFRFVEERGLSPSCQPASKLGIVRIKTPLLPRELEGSLYLAEPAPEGEEGKNPFDSLIALYLVAEDREAGVLVKLAGKGELNQQTGQLSTSFRDTPQLPFEELELELFGGQRASLSTPAVCGSYPTVAEFTPWSTPLGATPVIRTSAAEEFDITENCSSSGSLPFSPSFDAQSESAEAGSFSDFQLAIERPDGQQALNGVTVTLPPGLAAMLSTVMPCPEPAGGVEWSCGQASRIGESIAESGVGGDPVSLPGEVFLTTGYDGAPFGLLVRTLAQAGPFDLGWVNVRSRINVNQETAQVTVTTDPGPRGEALPTIIKGIPVDLKRLLIDVDRAGFEFNPTSCEPMSVTGALSGSEGASAPASTRFQVGGCSGLPFHPVLSASVGGHASKDDGASFAVRIESQGLGVANIRKVDVQLPEQLPSRDETLKKACLEAVFAANPAGCGAESIVGYATVHTPVLKAMLTGPAYLVSHGGEAFPDLEFVLQGEGITLILDGKTQIKDGITYSRFETAPDAPFTTFETVLPAGPHSILGAYANAKSPYELCPLKLTLPTTITAQDGAVIEQEIPITPTGCNAVLASRTRKPSRAQQLQSALERCRREHPGHKHRNQRISCEKAARKHYARRKVTPSRTTRRDPGPRRTRRARGHRSDSRRS